MQALIQKAQEGVQVRVLLDGLSNANKDFLGKLTAAGGQIAYFRPIVWWDLYRITSRNHVRDVVIDGKVSYLGGIAVSDLWLGDATTPDEWHDYMYKLDAPMTKRLESTFYHFWSETTGEIVQTTPVQIVPPENSSTHFVSLFSVPSPDMSSSMEQFVWLSIEAAHKSIHIEDPYILPSGAILKALKDKAKEGVDVSIILPSSKTDAPYTRWASMYYYGDLLSAGIHIYEYQPSRIHAKVMTMDGIWSIVGSANLDNRSSRINLELILGIDDARFAEDLEGKFRTDLTNSREITKEEEQKRPLFDLLIEWASRLFRQQY